MGSISSYLSNVFNVDVNAVSLFLAILAAYPINLIYVLAFRNVSSRVKCYYFFLCGLTIISLTFQLNALHSFINCVFCYTTLKYVNARVALTLNFIFTNLYLLYGYYVNQLDWHYTVTWTIPQCMLTLKLIAFSFDIYDGHCIEESKKVFF